MKILAILLLKAGGDEPHQLSGAYHLDDFNFFQKEGAKQFATFVAKTVAGRVTAGSRASVEHANHLVHVHSRSTGLILTAVCDSEYPSRVAYTLLMKVHDDFVKLHPNWNSANINTAKELPLPFPELEGIVKRYQNPAEADNIMKIQKDLDDTKIILHKTIDSVLERGTKLDNLVEKSTDLSAQSKMFYKTAKKQNSCCGMM